MTTEFGIFPRISARSFSIISLDEVFSQLNFSVGLIWIRRALRGADLARAARASDPGPF